VTLFNRAGIALAVLLAPVSAMAADLPSVPTTAAAAAVAPYDWTGFYIGLNGGYAVGRDRSTLYPLRSIQGNSFTSSPEGWFGGVQAGVNWQTGQWVIGVEADAQWSGQQGTTCFLCFNFPFFPEGSLTHELPWFATVRARLGYAMGSVLLYSTGGVALGEVRSTIDCCLGTPVVVTNRRTGWTLGSGIEAALAGNWTAKVEYLYVDLGDISDLADIRFSFGHLAWDASSSLRNHITRVGLNYRFGGGAAASGWSTEAAADWSGFYVGAVYGYAVARNATVQSSVFLGGLNDIFTLALGGWLGGAQAGFNLQSGRLVYGIEADWQWTNQKDGVCRNCPPELGPGTQIFEQRLNWFGTLRGRVGHVAGSALFYVTGGLAYGQIDTEITEVNLPAVQTASFKDTRTGWALGGGIEAKLLGQWSSKTEYLYVDLGSISQPTNPTFVSSLSTHVRNHVFRSGLSYHFTTDSVAARY
jgi:outer membrane immunogenic protein